jgi:hypothetical protein
MDNYKLVKISIFTFLKYDKNDFIFFLENIYEKLLGFSCMHGKKTYFFDFFILKSFRENRVFLISNMYLTMQVYNLI